MSKPRNSAAFPRPGSAYDAAQPGMSLRDWFASQALVGMLACPDIYHPTAAAEGAYQYADAMLKAREPK